MSSIAENKMYPTIRMSKTKKRVTAATKLQALVRGKLNNHPCSWFAQTKNALRKNSKNIICSLCKMAKKRVVHVKAHNRSSPHKKKHAGKKHKAAAKSKSKGSAMPVQLRRSSRLKK